MMPMVRQRSDKHDTCAGHGVIKREAMGVEEHITQTEMAIEESVLLAVAMDTVVDDVVAQVSEMLTKLVPAPSSG